MIPQLLLPRGNPSKRALIMRLVLKELLAPFSYLLVLVSACHLAMPLTVNVVICMMQVLLPFQCYLIL